MASGKLSPRQKMINLMYLVFIAMLALNMSKEVLTAFGLINERLVESNQQIALRNNAAMEGLAEKANEMPEKYLELKKQADQVDKLSADFYGYIESVKAEMMNTIKEDAKTDYETQDKADFLDQKWFTGGVISEDGQKFLDNMNAYREGMIQVLGENNPTVAEIKKKFNTDPVENKDGKKIDYLNYHFEHYPFISSMTKLSMFQSDIRTVEAQVLGDLLRGQLTSEVSMTNYKAIVIPEKSAFFNGENFKGRVVLGRYDATTVPTEVIVNGQKQEKIEQGQVILDFPAGAVGERELKGKFVFMQDGEPVEIEINDKYAVIPKPNSATISADKMNVVYRGVDNPMTISFAGVSDNNVNASAAGLTRKSGSSYVMRPGTGTEVTINVTGTLPDGQKVSDSQKFRIKNIPRPTGTVRGDNTGYVKMPKSTLEKVDIGAELVDFDFDLKLVVKGFKLSVPGQPTVAVNGNKLNAAAVNALKKAKRGDIIQIFDINADIVGNSTYKVGNVSGVSVEITN